MLKLVALKLVHWWLRVRHFFLACWKTTKASFRATLSRKTKQFSDMRADSKRLQKLPLHISFAVNENEIRVEDLARLVVWSFSIGISCISLYDRAGVIKARKDQLGAQILRVKDQLTKREAEQFSVKIVTADTISGESCRSGALVLLLSGKDGRQSVVDVVQSLCSSRASRRLCLDSFLVADFDKRMLLGTLGIGEPELIVRFGGENCLNGYPPWIMRVSEIQYLHSHHSISFDLFMTPIRAYADCEQRLGK